jgi:hypothetical protein
MNELVSIKQNFGDYATLISVDKSVKRLEVEFNSTSTKVTKVVVEIKEHCHDSIN